MPSVFPESDSRVKLGRPQSFAVGSSQYFAEHRLWLFRSAEGFYCMSSVCTHLGCVAEREDDGAFLCPCHGSRFEENGDVSAGPAPRGLIWLQLALNPEGQLVVDKLGEVPVGTVFKV